MPVMGLARLKRALEGEIPSFDSLPPGRQGPAGLGDIETAPRRKCLGDLWAAKAGERPDHGTYRKGVTCARDEGC